jgi:hypothetical protein
MNALKNLLNSIRGKASQAAAGAAGAAGGAGGPKLPNAGAALGSLATVAALGGIGYGAYHSMVTSTWDYEHLSFSAFILDVLGFSYLCFRILYYFCVVSQFSPVIVPLSTADLADLVKQSPLGRVSTSWFPGFSVLSISMFVRDLSLSSLKVAAKIFR